MCILVFELSEEIVENLDGSPLAIEQAGALLSSRGPLSVECQESYLLQLKDQYTTVMAFQPGTEESYYDKDNKSILSAFSLLEAAIGQGNPDAIKLLTLCSFLDTRSISISMLLRFKQMRPDLVPPLLSTLLLPQHCSILQWLHAFFDRISNQESSLQQAVTILGRFCCVKIEWHKGSIGSFTIENAISRWCRGRLSRTDLEKWTVASAYMLSCCCQTVAGQNLVVFERKILAHIRSCDDFLLCTNLQSKQCDGADNLLSWYEWHCSAQFAKLYYNYRAFSDALRAIRRAHDLELLLRGNSYLKNITSLEQYHLMAIIYRDSGEYTEAGSIFVELLSACKESLAFGDPFTMKVAKESKDLWAKIAHDDTLRQRASAAVGDKKTAVWSPPREMVQGEDHLDMLNGSQRAVANVETLDQQASRHSLAMAYLGNGQASKAVALLEQIVEIRATTLAETHPDRLASQHNLAIAYRDIGQAPKAIALLEKIVKIQATILAETHPDRLAVQHNLAFAYWDNWQAPKAIALLEKVVEIRATTLAEMHPNRLVSQHNLAIAYRDIGQAPKAIALLEKIVKIQATILAETHPRRLASQHALTDLLQQTRL